MPASFDQDVDLIVEIGFGSAGPVAIGSTVWTDVTADVRAWRTSRGKQHELDRFEAGTATVVLDNRSGDYTPENTSGAHSPFVRVRRRLRIRAVHNAVTHDLFSGFVESYNQVWDTKMAGPSTTRGVATTVVRAVDGFKVLAQTELPESVWAFTIEQDLSLFGDDVLWYRLGDAADSVTATNSGLGRGLDGQWAQGGFATIFGHSAEGLIHLSGDGASNFQQSQSNADRIDIPQVITDFPFSIEAWIKMPGDGVVGQEPNIAIIVGSMVGGGTVLRFPGTLFFIDSAGFLVLFIDDGNAGSFARWTSDRSIDDGEIHHVVATALDNTSGGVQLFIDGFDHTDPAGFEGVGSVTVPTENQRWFIGPAFFTTQPVEPYVIDEVLIYPEINLTDARVTTHALAGLDTATGQRPDVAWGLDTPAERITRILDYADIRTVDRDLDTGNSVLQPTSLGGTALTYLQKLDETELGAFYITNDGVVRFRERSAFFTEPAHTDIQATFGDDVGELPYTEVSDPTTDDTRVLNDAKVTRDRGTTKRSEDAASIVEHFRQRFVADGLLHENDEVSQDYADFITLNFADQQLRLDRLSIEPQAAPADLWPQVLGRALEDRIRLLRRPPGGITVDREFHIVGIQHSSSAQPRRWVTEFQLAPKFQTDEFWLLGIVGRSELGETTVLGF